MASISFNTNVPITGGYTHNYFTFIVEGEQLQIETRYLLPCDYFNTMLSHGMQESITRTITIQTVSKQTVEAFLHFLKTYQLPTLDSKHLIELYTLVHQYQHHALLEQVRVLVIKAIPFCPSDVLTLGCIYDDQQIKTACKEYVEKTAIMQVYKGLFLSL